MAESASRLQVPTRSPSTPPHTASSRLSVSSCRTTRVRRAPRASRTAISRRRLDPRASSRFATLAQAMRSTKPTAASSTSSDVRMSPDDLLVERDYCERHALIGIWMCQLQPAGDRPRSDARAFEVEAGPESRDRAQDDHAARWRRAVQPPGPPDLGIRDDRRPEGVRHDADNLVRLAAERHLTSENSRVSAEASYPEAVRDDRNPRRTRTVVLEREIAPACGRDAQNAEVLEGDLLPDERFRIAKSRDRRLPASDGGHTFERFVLAGQIHEVPGGGVFARGAAAGRHVLPDHRDSVRIPVWQGPEQQGIHHAEDGRVGADPEREGHGHHGREPGSSGDHSERIPQVLQKPVHPKSSCFVRIGRSTPSEPHAVPWVAESVIMYGGF